MRHLAAALLLLTLPLWSCTSTDDDPPHRSTTTLSPEAEVEAAYLAYWDMVQRVTESPDPNDPEVAQRTIDTAREQLTSGLNSLDASGRALQRGQRHAHSVSDITIDGQTAQLQDCAVDDSTLIDTDSGAVIEQAVTTELLEVSLVRQEDAWLLSNIERLKTWDGAVRCTD